MTDVTISCGVFRFCKGFKQTIRIRLQHPHLLFLTPEHGLQASRRSAGQFSGCPSIASAFRQPENQNGTTTACCQMAHRRVSNKLPTIIAKHCRWQQVAHPTTHIQGSLKKQNRLVFCHAVFYWIASRVCELVHAPFSHVENKRCGQNHATFMLLRFQAAYSSGVLVQILRYDT